MRGIRKLGQIRVGRYICCASHRAKFLQREGYFLHCGLATECSNEWISSAALYCIKKPLEQWVKQWVYTSETCFASLRRFVHGDHWGTLSGSATAPFSVVLPLGILI